MTGPHLETNQHLQMSYSSISLKLSIQFPTNVCSSNWKVMESRVTCWNGLEIFWQTANNAWWYVVPSPRGPMLNPEYPREQFWGLFYFSFMLTIYHLTNRLPSKCSLMTQRCTERSPILKTTLEPFKRISIFWRTGRLSGSLDSIQRMWIDAYNSQPWQVGPLLYNGIKYYVCQVYERSRCPYLLWFIVERPSSRRCAQGK